MKKVVLTLKMKQEIGKRIKKHKMQRREEISGAMVAIPETEDASGKPLFIPAVTFNKIWDKVKW